MEPVPFVSVGSVLQADGLVSLAGGELRLEFQTADKFLGVFKGRVQTLKLPLPSLVAVELQTGWVGKPRLVIQARSLQALAGLPGMAAGRVELVIAPARKAAAAALVDALHDQRT